jgi:ATP-dependent DNA helicase RecQ
MPRTAKPTAERGAAARARGPSPQRRVAQVLKETFGIDRLRPGQRTVIEQVLAGRPTLAIMPTGVGK